MPRDCPTCGDHLPSGKSSCPACGWAAPQVVAPVVFDGGCAWSHFGERCSNAGSVKRSTTGSGEWYCFPHFVAMDGDHDVDGKIVQASVGGDYSPAGRRALCAVPEIESRQAKQARGEISGKRQVPGRWWAKRILRRLELGERLPLISEQMAIEALPMKPREPGSDDEEQAA